MNEKIKVIKLESEVLENVSLNELKKQVGENMDFETLVLEIASPGGSVSEGFKIMLWLNEMSSTKTVISVVTGNADSIASFIMLAANYRIISSHGRVMIHNPMISELAFANASELEKYAKELRELEDSMTTIYSVFTGLEETVIKDLMNKESFLTPQQALEMGFVNEVSTQIKKRPYIEAQSIKTETNMSNVLSIQNKMKAIIAKVNGLSIVNQMYYTKEGSEIEIFQTDPANYAVGDKTNLENGTATLADGSLLTVENYKITSIEKLPVEQEPESPTIEIEVESAEAEKPAVEDVEGEKPAEKDETLKLVQELSDKIESLEEKVKDLEMTLGTQASFNEGQIKKNEEFESVSQLVVETVDALASSQASNFKPSARSNAEAKPTGLTIFDEIKQRRGLK